MTIFASSLKLSEQLSFLNLKRLYFKNGNCDLKNFFDPGICLSQTTVLAKLIFACQFSFKFLQANQHYAHVRSQDGRETTVSTKHLAPCSQSNVSEDKGKVRINDHLPREQSAIESGAL